MNQKLPTIKIACRLSIILAINLSLHFNCKSQLSAGDIAFLGYNSNNPDAFSIIALKDIPGNTEIKFTDKGWKADNTFRSHEGTIVWNAPKEGVPFGNIIHFHNPDEWKTSSGMLTGSISLVDAGDQILAYTGEDLSPQFLAAIHYSSTGDWQMNSTNSSTSLLPQGLVNDSTAMALSLENNAVYAGKTTGTRPELLSLINNPSNWYSNRETRIDLAANNFPFCVFSASEGEWHNALNWITSSLPDQSASVIIPESYEAEINGPAACKNLFIEPRGMLQINLGKELTINNLVIHSRSSSFTGCLINKGACNISGISIFERYLPDNNWHIVSSPVEGQKLLDFARHNFIEFNARQNRYDLAPYDESSDRWQPYISDENESKIELGKGYAMRRSTETTDGIIRFTGKTNTSETTVSLAHNSSGWNCIGNPFPSELQATGTSAISFLNTNSHLLDPNYAGLYIWASDLNDYEVWGNFSSKKMASAQGFLVRSKTGGATLNFTNEMQVSSQISFKTATRAWSMVSLHVNADSLKNSTTIAFNQNMTTALDPTYDIGKLKGNPNLAVYTELVEKDGHHYAVQALPDKNFSNYRIAVGLDFPPGGDVFFSVTTDNFPESMEIYLEDSQNQILHRADIEDIENKFTIPSDTRGFGRFYLRFGKVSSTGTNTSVKYNFCPVVKNKRIEIELPESDSSLLSIFDITGKVHKKVRIQHGGKAVVDANSLADGVYIMQLKQSNQIYSAKLILRD